MSSARERRLFHEFDEMQRFLRPGSLIDFRCSDLSGAEATAFLWGAMTEESILEYLDGFLSPAAFKEQYPTRPPEKYLVEYRCKGLMLDQEGQINVLEKHLLEIVYGLDYPEVPPSLVWLTPIWHPNIKKPYVCTKGRPFAVGTLLAQLCLMIGRMIQYYDYNVESPLNHDAAAWARHNANRFPVDHRSLLDGQVHERPDTTGLVELVSADKIPLVELL